MTILPGQIGGTRFRHLTATSAPDARCPEIDTLEPEITPSLEESALPPWWGGY